MDAISNSNTAFALELLRTLSQENPVGNVFVSPLSISAALAMVYLGARGDTAAQMAQVRQDIVSAARCTPSFVLISSITWNKQNYNIFDSGKMDNFIYTWEIIPNVNMF